MSKFAKISFALALAIFVASPVSALEDVFDPLADLYLELEEKADPNTAPDSEPAGEVTTDDYLTELEKMAAKMEAVANGESTTTDPETTEPETVEPADENNSVEPPTGAKISQSGGAIENAITEPDENLTTATTATTTNTTALVASADVGSEVFVFAYDGSVATHSAASELTAAGPAAVALFALAGGLVGAYFWRRKIFDV